MSRRSGPWAVLGIDRTADVKAIRRAYADKLKAMDIDREAAQYASLRDARDNALRWAKMQVQAEEAGPLDDEWSIAGDAALYRPEDDDFDLPDMGGRHEQDGSFLSSAPDDLTGETLTASPPAGPAEPTLPMRFDHLLFPDGQYSDASFTLEEAEQAHAVLLEIVDDIFGGDLTQHRMGNEWVADRLASAWPRSSPLVATAAEAFEWEKEHGQLGEGRAQAFLNSRLRGMRFYEKAQQPDHWANKAWKELEKPGQKGTFGFMRASQADVHKLLTGIREHFPELESYLDPEKVRTWEPQVYENHRTPWFTAGRILVGLFLAFQILRLFSSGFSDDDTSRPQSPFSIDQQLNNWSPEQKDELAQDLFGSEMTFDRLALDFPELADRFEILASGGRSDATVIDALKQYLRAMILLTSDNIDFELLVRTKQFKLDVLNLALQESGTPACAVVLNEARLLPNISVPSDLAEEERALAAALLDRGALKVPGRQPERTAMIPGAMFDAAERKSGVSGEAAKQAALGNGNDANRCKFRIALMAEVLRRPGNVSADLLKML